MLTRFLRAARGGGGRKLRMLIWGAAEAVRLVRVEQVRQAGGMVVEPGFFQALRGVLRQKIDVQRGRGVAVLCRLLMAADIERGRFLNAKVGAKQRVLGVVQQYSNFLIGHGQSIIDVLVSRGPGVRIEDEG